MKDLRDEIRLFSLAFRKREGLLTFLNSKSKGMVKNLNASRLELKYLNTAGCQFGEGCHFLHFLPGGYNAVAAAHASPRGGPMAPPPIPDGHGAPASSVKSRICNKYSSPGGCKFGDGCRFAHGEGELGTPFQSSHMGPPPPTGGGRMGGGSHMEPPPPAGFGASATAKISVDASLAGPIIGKGGVNTKQICRITGAKLAIRDHESDANLKNVELEGTFDHIKEASAMVWELIMNLGAANPMPMKTQAVALHSAGNYKTKFCDKFAKGTCTFGDRCRFLHGANELR